jgi:hypothetical protein
MRRTQVFTFPSGMQVELQGRSISSMKKTIEKMRGGMVATQTEALQDATVRLVEPGYYKNERIASGGRVNWDNALSEDRVYGLLATRCVSYTDGHEFNMEISCGNCGVRMPWFYDLRPVNDGGELVVYHFTEEDGEIFRSGEPFEGVFMGKKIKWGMLSGHDEGVIEKLGMQDPDLDTDDLSLAMRIKELEGVDPSDKVQWISELGEERLELQEMMEDHGCGLDTMMSVFCKTCQTRDETPLPFGIADFWVPLTKIRKRRRERSAKARGLSVRSHH